MSSSRLILVLCSLVSIAVSQCPPGNCPPPVDPPNCGAPDCSIPTNRYHPNALFPHPDPNYYWQCAPTAPGVWEPLARLCACGSVFNVNVYLRRCTFWFEEGWSVPPSCPWTVPPVLRPCDPWCPDCNGPNLTPQTTTPTVPTTTPSIPTTTTTTGVGIDPETTTPGNGCGCPPSCPPCIWWPCIPCNPCWCKQQQQQQQQPPRLSWK